MHGLARCLCTGGAVGVKVASDSESFLNQDFFDVGVFCRCCCCSFCWSSSCRIFLLHVLVVCVTVVVVMVVREGFVVIVDVSVFCRCCSCCCCCSCRNWCMDLLDVFVRAGQSVPRRYQTFRLC